MLLRLFDYAYAEIDFVEVLEFNCRLQVKRNVFRFFVFLHGFADCVQLFQFLFDVQSREDSIALLHLFLIHHFKLKRILPYDICVPKTHLLADFLGSRVHERIDQNRDDADCLCKVVQNRVQSSLCFRVGVCGLCKHPRRFFVDIFVCTANNNPDFFQCHVERKLVHLLFHLGSSTDCNGAEICVDFVHCR